MWTEAARKRHAPRKGHYPSDLTDAEWALIAPLIPPAQRGGRPRETDMREVMNAVRYVLRTGCQWRQLPKSSRRVPRFTAISGNGRDTACSTASITHCLWPAV